MLWLICPSEIKSWTLTGLLYVIMKAISQLSKNDKLKYYSITTAIAVCVNIVRLCCFLSLKKIYVLFSTTRGHMLCPVLGCVLENLPFW